MNRTLLLESRSIDETLVFGNLWFSSDFQVKKYLRNIIVAYQEKMVSWSLERCRNVFIVSLSLDVSKLSSRQVNKHTITIKYCSKAGSNLQNNDYNGKSISTAIKRNFCTTTFQRKWKTFKIEPLVLIEHHWEASSEKTRAN